MRSRAGAWRTRGSWRARHNAFRHWVCKRTRFPLATAATDIPATTSGRSRCLAGPANHLPARRLRPSATTVAALTHGVTHPPARRPWGPRVGTAEGGGEPPPQPPGILGGALAPTPTAPRWQAALDPADGSASAAPCGAPKRATLPHHAHTHPHRAVALRTVPTAAAPAHAPRAAP